MAEWTPEDVEILKAEYPAYGSKCPSLVEKFTHKAIAAKANCLKIQKISSWKTSKDERCEEKMQNCGYIAKIIAYRNSRDIDVLFPETGIIRKSVDYGAFRKGNIAMHPRKKREKVSSQKINAERCLGMTIQQNNGLNATIIKMSHLPGRVDCLFENGITRENVLFHAFLKGQVRDLTLEERAKIHVGEKNIMNNGEEGVITEFTERRFLENGAIPYRGQKKDKYYYKVETKSEWRYLSYTYFKNGFFLTKEEEGKLNVGKETINSQGLTVRIIKYNNYNDVDLLFVETGNILKHKNYDLFKDGCIDRNYRKKLKLANEEMMSCGLNAKVVEYRAYNDVDIQFEDGYTVFHRDYNAFKKRTVSHFGFHARHTKMYGDIITKYAFRLDDIPYYMCKCKKCGYEDILKAKDVVEHKKTCCNE